MNTRILNNIFILAAGVACALGCKIDDAEYRSASEFGTLKHEYQVPYKSGSLEMEFLSNETFSISIVEEGLDWITFPDGKTTYDGDAVIKIDYATNSGFPRLGRIALASASRKDTVTVKQEGFKAPQLKFNNVSLAIQGNGGQITTPLATNLDIEDITPVISYNNENDPQWISNLRISNGMLVFDAASNPNETDLRRATIRLDFVDGWGNSTSSSLMLTQANANNEFGVLIPLESVRDMAGAINSDYIIEGVVISELGNENVGDNLRLTESSIDYTGNPTTAYIQTKNGEYGFMIKTKTAADNVFERYSTVRLLIRGTTVLEEQNPHRFTIDGVTADMVLSSTGGTEASLAPKQKHIKDLTDDDMYTWVELLDCEFGIKKGPITPINEGYGCVYSSDLNNPTNYSAGTNYIGKFPALVIDNQGGSLYTFTNTKVPYRRVGKQLPYGAGTFKGIIVHESFDQYTWAGEPNESNIGRYQIRHLEESDYAFAAAKESSTVGYVVEYQYAIINNNVINPTDGSNNGYLTHSSPDPNSGTTAYNMLDFTYLGPIGKYYVEKVYSGNGVYLPDGSMLCKSPKTNRPAYPTAVASDGNAGKCQVDVSDNSGWRMNHWWNQETDSPEAWLLKLSTAGVSTDHLTLVFSAGGQGFGSPRYMSIDWNTVGDNKASGWQRIADIDTPEGAQWGNVRWWQLPGGYKQFSIELPLEMLGKEEVWIRFTPTKNASGSASVYDTAEINPSAHWCMNYLAVRYSK